MSVREGIGLRRVHLERGWDGDQDSFLGALDGQLAVRLFLHVSTHQREAPPQLLREPELSSEQGGQWIARQRDAAARHIVFDRLR